MGDWLKINGDAIYGTRYWKVNAQENEHLAFTTKGKTLYAIKLAKPSAPFTIEATAGWKKADVKSVRLLGSESAVDWAMTSEGLRITPPSDLGTSQFAWSFEIVTTSEQHHPNVIVSDADQALKRTGKVDLDGRVNRARASKYLETGGRRKLDVVYKKVAARDLQLGPLLSGRGIVPTSARLSSTPTAEAGRPKPLATARGSFAAVFTQLVEKGFCVASVDYRLYRKGGKVSMHNCVIDCKDAVRYLARNSESLGMDPMRMYVMGDSAGGQIAQMLLLSSPEPAGRFGTGRGDLQDDRGCLLVWALRFREDRPVQSRRPGRFSRPVRARILKAGTPPEDKLKLYREMSPINYVTKQKPTAADDPGRQDTTIPVKHAYYMPEQARELKAPVEILIVKNAGHNWRRVDAAHRPSRQVIVDHTVQLLRGPPLANTLEWRPSPMDQRTLGILLIALVAFGVTHVFADDDQALVAVATQRRRAKVFNVRSYGAVGDGVAMDTAAVQKTIDACHAKGGRIVRVPSGDFQIGTICASKQHHPFARSRCQPAGGCT